MGDVVILAYSESSMGDQWEEAVVLVLKKPYLQVWRLHDVSEKHLLSFLDSLRRRIGNGHESRMMANGLVCTKSWSESRFRTGI